ncbi:hypothetical protein MKW92_038343, partial [Papaver armeniacum]
PLAVPILLESQPVLLVLFLSSFYFLIAEVALHLMIMHEECLQGKFESIEKLRTTSNGSKAVSQSTLVVNEDDDSDDNDLISESAEMLVDDLKESKTIEVEEGWCVVAAKKSKSRGCSSSKRISS